MRRWMGLAAGGAAVLGIAGGLRALAFRLAQRSMLVAGMPGVVTPEDVGVPYEPFEIASGRRRLAAWWLPVPLERDRRRAVLVFHGRNETVCEWVGPLRYLWERGVSTLVFDYSGFGASTGVPTVGALREDVRSAWQAFRERTEGQRRYVLGLSLGTGFLLDGLAAFGKEVDGVALLAPYSSARRAAVETGAMPAFLSLLLPDPLDNIGAVRRVAAPLLVVCSRDDDLLPCSMAEQVYAAAPGPKRLVVLEGLRHRDLLGSGYERTFAPVIEFLEDPPGGGRMSK